MARPDPPGPLPKALGRPLCSAGWPLTEISDPCRAEILGQGVILIPPARKLRFVQLQIALN